MAEVFLAKMTGAEGLEKVLVVKRVLPAFGRSPKFLAMFVDEAKLAMRLNHPNIVQVYSFDQVRGEGRASDGPKEEFLLAMEYVDGMDLGRLLSAARRANKRLTPNLAALIALEVAKGLDYAHNRKDESGTPMDIVHRDVSPQNVLVSYDGAVKIADFGIARARMISEETGVIKGKFGYMSPEQAKGQRVDRRSDVYALGVMLAELLMGRAMYPGIQGMEVLEEVRLGRVTSPRAVDPSVPPELDQIVMRALATDREERYQTCRSLAGALSRYLHAQDEPPDLELVERFLSEVAPRELTSPEVSGAKEVPIAAQATVLSVPSVSGPLREVRERRHVLVLTGFFRDAQGTSPGFATRDLSSEQALQMIEEIAFKYGAILDRPPVSPGTPSFNLILGLGRSTVDDPLHASRMALDILEALVGLSADAIRPLNASVGISRGMVTSVRSPDRRPRWEPEGSVLAVARDLARAADAGSVLTSGEVYRLARRAFAFDEVAREVSIEADGKKSLRGWRLMGAHGARHLAKKSEERSAAGLVGRESEVAALSGIWQEIVTTGKGAWIAVVGELGVGKTALISHAVAELDPSPQVVRAECAFGSNDVPFSAVAEIVSEALGLSETFSHAFSGLAGTEGAPAKGSAEESRAALDRALLGLGLSDGRRRNLVEAFEPLFAGGVTDGERDASSAEGFGDRTERLYTAVRTLLALLARRRPLLVWVDAVQFMDPPSRELLARLVQGELEVPIAVVFSTRPDPKVEAALRGALRVDVGELDEAARRALVHSHLGQAQMPPELLSAITQRAGGNPFFLLELVDALLERGTLRIEGEGSERRVVRKPGAALQLPSSLEDVVAARIAELDERERTVLRWLAVAGPGLREDELDLLIGEDASAALGVLGERGLIELRAGGQISFASMVVRHVAYESTDASDRARMHRRVGAHFDSRPGRAPAARIARHHELAGEARLAAVAWREAGERARAAYSNREALRFWGRALSLLPDASPERFELHERREHVLRTLSLRNEQRVELEAMRNLAEGLRDERMLAIALSRLARHDLDVGRLAGVDALLRRALDAAIAQADRGAEIECLRLFGHLRRDQGDVEGALDAFERALARAGLLEEHLPARAMTLVNRSNLLWRCGKLEQGVESAAEGYAIFRRLDMKGQAAFALNSLGVVLASSGRFEDAIACVTASIVLDRAVGDRIHLGRKVSNIGQLYAELGAVDRALEFLEHALRIFSSGDDQPGRTDALSASAELRVEQLATAAEGPARVEILDEADRELAEAEKIASRLADRADLAHARLVRAGLEAARGRWAQAEETAREAALDARAAGTVGFELQAEARVLDALLARDAPELKEAADRLHSQLGAHPTVERGERVLLSLIRAFQRLNDATKTQSTLGIAQAMLARRQADIRDASLAAQYRQHPVVSALEEAST
jgi:serine/threonine protein kinase/tetratricopeptide (TPR) repeat protein